MPETAGIYYNVFQGAGEGERLPVVLLHGAGGSHLSWPVEMRRLPGHRIYALDLPGHGKSGGRGQQSIPGYGQTVLDWMEAAGLHRAVFAGHSMGAGIAIWMALEHLEQVVALALFGASARLLVNPLLLESTGNPTTFLNGIDTILAWSFSTQAPPRLVELVRLRMAETRQSVLHGDLLACNGFDETSRIAQIQQPSVVVCGSQDQMTPVRASQFLVSSLVNASLAILTGAGHMVMLERPVETAAMLRDFLGQLPAP